MREGEEGREEGGGCQVSYSWLSFLKRGAAATMREPGPPLVVMRGKVTLEVVWHETVCEEALQGGLKWVRWNGGVRPVLLLGAAVSRSSIGGGGSSSSYTTVPLGELAWLF